MHLLRCVHLSPCMHLLRCVHLSPCVHLLRRMHLWRCRQARVPCRKWQAARWPCARPTGLRRQPRPSRGLMSSPPMRRSRCRICMGLWHPLRPSMAASPTLPARWPMPVAPLTSRAARPSPRRPRRQLRLPGPGPGPGDGDGDGDGDGARRDESLALPRDSTRRRARDRSGRYCPPRALAASLRPRVQRAASIRLARDAQERGGDIASGHWLSGRDRHAAVGSAGTRHRGACIPAGRGLLGRHRDAACCRGGAVSGR